MPFRALMTDKLDGRLTTSLVQLDDKDLMDGDVVVDVEYSAVNYKDGLAITGASPIISRFPLIPGIDLSGTVASSSHADFKADDKVVLNGWALSQTHHGGYAERARVKGEWLVKLPSSIDTRRAMAIGTAGYTAMLSVLALEHGGLTPERGDVLVTGANGGVGSIAIGILAKLGYRVIASTGRLEHASHLLDLGAAEVIDRATLSEAGRPIATPRWAGAVDSVGSMTLSNVLARTNYRGVVAACGLAQGQDLPGSMLPFILRNVTLAGIDSVNAPARVRAEAWSRLARDLDPGRLDQVTTEIALAEVPEMATVILQGQVRGRTVVDVRR